MKYFKDSNGQIFGFEDDGSQDHLITEGMEPHEIEAPAPGRLTSDQVDAARLLAYANPVTGSDRYMAEAMAERAQGNEDGAKAAEAKMIERREEIKAANPWPVEE